MKPFEAPDENVGSRRTTPIGMMLALFLIGAGTGAGAYRMVTTLATHPKAPVAIPEAPSLMVRDDQGVMVPEGSPLRDKLTIAAVNEKPIKRNLVLPAVVEADPARLVKVLPPLPGRITQLKVQLGEEVVQGQPLAVLDAPDLAAAYADYDRAKALISLAIKNRDRMRELQKTNAVATRDAQQAETDYVTAEVENRRAEARLRQIGVDPDAPAKTRTVTITAPVSGSVIDLAVAPGALWNDATAALMTVADLHTVWVTANVPEKDTALVAKGQSVDIVFAAYPDGAPVNGQVLFVSNVLDADTRRTKVRINIQNSDMRFKPAMFATATFHGPDQTMPLIPTSALILKDDINQVFIEVPRTGTSASPAGLRFKAVPVKLGFEQGDDAVIERGLKVGDRVVVKGGVLLND